MANIPVYAAAWLLLHVQSGGQAVTGSLGPADVPLFRVRTETFLSDGLHLLTDAGSHRDGRRGVGLPDVPCGHQTGPSEDPLLVPAPSPVFQWKHWLKEPSFYQVTGISAYSDGFSYFGFKLEPQTNFDL